MEVSDSIRVLLVVILQLSLSVWLGGYVASAIVAFVSRETLGAEARVRFFRVLGRAFLPVGGAAAAAALRALLGLLSVLLVIIAVLLVR